jgi:hypothetical protein
MDDETLCRIEAARRRAAFLDFRDGELTLEIREPAMHVAKALCDRGFNAAAKGPFTLALRAVDWEAFWRQAGPLLECGC